METSERSQRQWPIACGNRVVRRRSSGPLGAVFDSSLHLLIVRAYRARVAAAFFAERERDAAERLAAALRA
jgi:hypothetical protein